MFFFTLVRDAYAYLDKQRYRLADAVERRLR